MEPAMVEHVCNFSTQELRYGYQQNETLSQRKKLLELEREKSGTT